VFTLVVPFGNIALSSLTLAMHLGNALVTVF